MLAESGSKWASRNYRQNQDGFTYQVVNALSAQPEKNDYDKLLDSIDIEECIREGYFAIYHQKAKMTAGILAFIFGTEQERDNFVKTHPDSKYDLTDFEGFKKTTKDRWRNLDNYKIDFRAGVIAYDEP